MRKTWEKQLDYRSFRFRIVGPDGSPARAEMFVRHQRSSDYGCDYGEVERLGKTDESGVLQTTLAIEDVSELWFGEDGWDDQHFVDDAQLIELSRRGELTLTWRRP